MLVFLDLEETLVDDWSSQLLLTANVRVTRSFLKTLPPGTKVGLMSWAVWDERDKSLFNKDLRPFLEAELDVQFSDDFVWSMDDWAQEVFNSTGMKLSREDLFDVFGKHEVLFKLSRHSPKFEGHQVVLVDDVAEHMLKWDVPHNRCSATMLNVKEMLREHS